MPSNANTSFLSLVLAIAAALLLIAIAPLPYGYYKFLRVAACLVFAWACVSAVARDRLFLAAVLAAAAVLFNPLFPITLDKPTWVVFDALAAALAALSAWRLKEQRI